ncbi:MAG: dihydroorotate dehydrogenase [Deltaproteobacteria bacterium]|jgi:dihydroorotate dehydrogenase (NAD+) catalytic subunit|nr:dihydroorotate dehydrogenase [Deltaproteobacteria bacterium]MBT4637988.1 dihydroorotate dehydrogenase [Deltaproteobacteria bacterium]MBT6501038.1 dihydroorotate dehydrogenase [Deltaproteobacteria bacterium]MBT6612816.1 dihydroorotate dehydrogenase [Deltaproteobacteria bacterium]MBT7715414.1 dihydroorotate dehydrogenase [Deltaproteobacteria bacterium]
MSEIRPKMTVNIGSIKMKNPVTVASGTFGYGPEYAELVDLNRLGAITVKGICAEPHTGNPTPRTFETRSGMLNAIGLPGPGAKGFIEKYAEFLSQYDLPVIVNVWGKTVADYGRVVEMLSSEPVVSGFEVNVSCPNIKEGGALYGTDLQAFSRVIEEVRGKTAKPVIPKLAPNVSNIALFAKAAEDRGADAISIMNSFPAMAINIETRKPELANRTGGLSGPAIKPIAIKLVWEAARAVTIPIIGMGGINCPEDAIEFIIAGAAAVAVGTANFTDPSTAIRVIEGIEAYLIRHGIASVDDLRGTVC